MEWNPQQKRAARAISNAFRKKEEKEEKEEPSLADTITKQIEERKKKLQGGWGSKPK